MIKRRGRTVSRPASPSALQRVPARRRGCPRASGGWWSPCRRPLVKRQSFGLDASQGLDVAGFVARNHGVAFGLSSVGSLRITSKRTATVGVAAGVEHRRMTPAGVGRCRFVMGGAGARWKMSASIRQIVRSCVCCQTDGAMARRAQSVCSNTGPSPGGLATDWSVRFGRCRQPLERCAVARDAPAGPRAGRAPRRDLGGADDHARSWRRSATSCTKPFGRGKSGVQPPLPTRRRSGVATARAAESFATAAWHN